MARTPSDLTSKKGWEIIEAELAEDSEALAKRHQTLAVQYGEAKLTSGRGLLRLILLDAGTDLVSWREFSSAAGSLRVSDSTSRCLLRLSARPLLCSAGCIMTIARQREAQRICELAVSGGPCGGNRGP
jgi:hypothetical protein